MKEQLVIYPGSFYPFHVGHLNIVEKIESIFGKEKLLIAIGMNPAKNLADPMSVILRADDLRNKMGRNIEVYSSFLHEFIQKKEDEGYDVIIARGLRNGDDLAYENNQLKFITDFKPGVRSIFIMSDKEFEHISSSSIHQLESFREGSAKKYLL